jgi:hypothetical protein
MEFLQWLKGEHQDARQLLSTALGADGRERQQAWEKFRTELQVHHNLEEKHLYPLGEGSEATKDLAEHAIEETHEADRMLEEIDPSSESFEDQARELQAMLEDHIEEEETELVPQLMKDVPGDQQSELVQKLQQEKQQELQGTR